jgi:hypothetical protein
MSTDAPNGKAANKVNGNKKTKEKKVKKETSNLVIAALVTLAAITYLTIPDPLQPLHGEAPTIQHVFYYGWLTAISTGLGVLPLIFAPNLGDFWVGISNGESPLECDMLPVPQVRALCLILFSLFTCSNRRRNDDCS